jgi:D-3-phosphoglycerate dehydrogenase / 2-oxoglutarate reductase
MKKIYLADAAIQLEQIDAIKEYLPNTWQITHNPEGAEAILTEHVSITEAMISQTQGNLQVVFKLEPGRAEIAAGNFKVVSCANTGLIGVAEHAVTLILALSRHFLWVTQHTTAGAWVAGKDQPILTDQKKYTFNWIGLASNDAIYDKTVGIIGLGYIGREVAKRLRPFGVRLVYFDVQRQPLEIEKELDIEYCDLDSLLQHSDFVTLHHRFVEGPQGNDGQFGKREFGLMKTSAYFINTSRGRMVNEADLVDAIEAGRIAGVGMDVFRYEPLPKDDPLLALASDKVILTAHVAGTYMPEAWRTTAEQIISYLK